MAGNYHYAPDSRVLTVADQRIALTEREGAALAFLMHHAGDVVSRATLEAEVWGMRPGVRSQTVPVTMRRLRAKLGEHDRIETIWGRGWRIPIEERTEREAPERPVYTTVLQPRPELSVLVAGVAEARCVTVVGPGGVGKTRLVDAWLADAHAHVWVTVLPSDRQDDLLRRIATQASLVAGTLEAISEALGDSRIVLDDAESSLEAVRALIEALGAVRFVVTSRQPVGVVGEHLVPLAGLHGDEGRAFLRTRLAGSRWARDYGDAVLDRVLKSLDGLPLALELATAQPEPLDAWVERVERDGLWGPEADRMARSVARSLERLEPTQLAVLGALGLAQAPVNESDLEDWLGPGSVPVARDLGARSLLAWDRGWRVLGTVAQHLPFDPDVREARDGFLCRWVAGLDLEGDPTGTADRLEPLADELLAMVPRVGPDDARPVVLALCELFAIRGPASAIAETAVAGARAHPTDPLLFGLSCLDAARPESGRMRPALESSDPWIRGWALWVQGGIEPEAVPLEVLERTLAELSGTGRARNDALALRLERIRLRARKFQGASLDLEAMWDLEMRSRGFPHVHGRLIGGLAAALDADGQPERALGLMEMELPTGISVLDIQLHSAIAFLWCAKDLDEGLARLEAAARESTRFGQRTWAADIRNYAAIFHYIGGGRWAGSVRLAGTLRANVSQAIEAHERGDAVELADLPEAFRRALRARWTGEPDALRGAPESRDTRILRAILRKTCQSRPGGER